MQFELKKLSANAIEAALERADTYRLLNQPYAAESICRDILGLDDDNVRARIMLILSLTDQFPNRIRGGLKEAEQQAGKLPSSYQRAYYSGLVLERHALATLEASTPGCGQAAFKLLRTAMEAYEHAETEKQAGNDESILRWNTCARIIMTHPKVKDVEPDLEPTEHFDG